MSCLVKINVKFVNNSVYHYGAAIFLNDYWFHYILAIAIKAYHIMSDSHYMNSVCDIPIMMIIIVSVCAVWINHHHA